MKRDFKKESFEINEKKYEKTLIDPLMLTKLLIFIIFQFLKSFGLVHKKETKHKVNICSCVQFYK